MGKAITVHKEPGRKSGQQGGLFILHEEGNHNFISPLKFNMFVC